MEITDSLVEYISSEILKRLGVAGAGSETVLPSKSGCCCPQLCLIGDISAKSRDILSSSYQLCSYTEFEKPVPQADVYLATKLSIQALVRLAEGDEGCTLEGRGILSALLSGKKVYVLKEGLFWRKFLATAPRALVFRYTQYESILGGYGVEFIEEQNIAVLGKSLVVQVPKAQGARPSFSGGQVVITESAIKEACPVSGGLGQEFILGQGVILTPLAKDYVQSMKVRIVSK